MRINLHTHSNISDGKLSPEELVLKLYEDGVKIFALTDHDKIDGVPRAKKIAEELGVQCISGIEISTNIFDMNIPFLDAKVHTFHMLGLNFSYEILRCIYGKREANKVIKLQLLNKKLIDLGYRIPIIEHLNRRVTLAKALVCHGYAKDEEAAFETIINHHYERWSDNIGIKDAIQMIHAAGGKILWAHPFEILIGLNKLTLNEEQVAYIAQEMKMLGVDGIEVYYGKYHHGQIDFLKTLQREHDYILSAGTDYHAKESQPNTFIDIDVRLLEGVLK